MSDMDTRGSILLYGTILAIALLVVSRVPVTDTLENEAITARHPIERRHIFPVTRPAFSGTPTIDAQYARILDKHKEKK